MKRFGETSFVARAAATNILAILALGACTGQSTEKFEKPVCRTATLKMGDGTYSALQRILSTEVMMVAPTQTDGFYETYNDAREALSQLRSGAAVQPGDSFRFCNDGTALTYEPHSAKLAK